MTTIEVLPNRAELARRLQGRGRDDLPRDVDAVAELDDERAREDDEDLSSPIDLAGAADARPAESGD